MKRLLFFIALTLGAQTGFKFNPITGQLDLVGLPGGANQTATSAPAVTSLAVDVTALNLTSVNQAVVQCWSGTAAPYSPVTITSLNPASTTSITANFTSTANVTCRVNASGSAGATGATGATGPTGATGASGTGAAPYTATVTAQTALTVAAATHNQGLTPIAMCFDSSTPAVAVNCYYTVSAAGAVVFAWGPAFTGSVVIIGGGTGPGTVTSVGWTGGIVSIATATTTPAFTIAGTSGGVPYFSSANAWGSSAALTASAVVLGGGAGAAPTSSSLTATVVKATAGVQSAATAGTDYYAPGSTDVAVTDGGTGASTAGAARTNLGLGYTVVVSCSDTNLVASTAAYCANFGTLGTNEAQRQYVIPVSGTITAFYVMTGTTAPTNDATCRIRLNESDQTPTVTVVAAGYSGPASFSASSPSIAVTAGNRLSMSCTGGASTQTQLRAWSIFVQ